MKKRVRTQKKPKRAEGSKDTRTHVRLAFKVEEIPWFNSLLKSLEFAAKNSPNWTIRRSHHALLKHLLWKIHKAIELGKDPREFI